MFIPFMQGASASTDSVAAFCALPPDGNDSRDYVHAEPVRHMLFGSPQSVRATIHQLHQLGYAEVNDWSPPISTRRADEVMAILTKRVRVEKS
ncbi:MAG: hypothetical protein WBC73_21290 [Phormidesmis sp.]